MAVIYICESVAERLTALDILKAMGILFHNEATYKDVSQVESMFPYKNYPAICYVKDDNSICGYSTYSVKRYYETGGWDENTVTHSLESFLEKNGLKKYTDIGNSLCLK